jgi:hypothetical protein
MTTSRIHPTLRGPAICFVALALVLAVGILAIALMVIL